MLIHIIQNWIQTFIWTVTIHLPITVQKIFYPKVFFNLSKTYKMTSTQNISISLLVYPEHLKRYIIKDEKLTCIWYIKLNTRSNFWRSFITLGNFSFDVLHHKHFEADPFGNIWYGKCSKGDSFISVCIFKTIFLSFIACTLYNWW